MGNGQDENMTTVLLERDNVWKPFDPRFADDGRRIFSARPAREHLRRFANALECRIDSGDEFLTQPGTPFLIPQSA
jgi:hypothetical protein